MLKPIGPVIFSIVIISKNEGHNLKQTIDHIILHKTSIPYEIIVVDDGSEDHSVNILETGDYKNVRTIHTEGIGPVSYTHLRLLPKRLYPIGNPFTGRSTINR